MASELDIRAISTPHLRSGVGGGRDPQRHSHRHLPDLGLLVSLGVSLWYMGVDSHFGCFF